MALNDRDLGDAVLDSLATAWGDSAPPSMPAPIAPTDPARSRLLNTYLLRILEAEKDSTCWPRRWCAAWPPPLPEPRTEAPAERTNPKANAR